MRQQYTQCSKCNTLLFYPGGEKAPDQAIAAHVPVLSIGVLGCAYCPEQQSKDRASLAEYVAQIRKEERERLIAAIRDWQARTLEDFLGTEDLSELLTRLEGKT